MAADQTMLETLEARFAELQRKVLGDAATVDEYERSYTRKKNETVVELLTDASASTRAALSGRDKIASVVPRMGELDRYLDPTFEDSLDVASLVELLLSCGPQLDESGRQLERLSELSPVLDSDTISGVSNHKNRIERLVLANLEKHELGEECSTRVYALVEEYNAIIINITKTLVQWDDMMTQMELERRPKKVVK